ncbi:hypothetical protein VTL71DRAFT_5462 [Oculimacula yallundae]|uniref:Protein kinase domain-containing protein n=1 Tax=Oculimacula yallundae TaxID=86028 RepID=A0ABR4C1S2_9HELO
MEAPMTNMNPGSSYSRTRPSRIPSTISMLCSVGLHDYQSSLYASYEMTALEEIIESLERAQLPGPAILMGLKHYIGSGAQFVVHQQTMVGSQMDAFFDSAVAVKQPKFNIDPSMALNLADKSAQQHLRNVVLEVEVLTQPALRRHPNIVRLLYWSFDNASVHLPISLVMELAICDLKKFLTDNPVTSIVQRYQIVAGVAAALDAIHECGFVHGDLKPENVLIFREQGQIVAKIADFGLSVKGSTGDEKREKLGGTPGWQAPEVEIGRALLPHELIKADNYSFALLCWSTLLGSGSPPAQSKDVERTELLARDLENAEDRFVEYSQILSIVKDVLHNLLSEDGNRRPRLLSELFDMLTSSDDNAPHIFDESEQLYPEPDFAADGFAENSETVALFTWEVPGLPHYFMESIRDRVMRYPEGYPPKIVSALVLYLTHNRFHQTPMLTALDVLSHVTLRGCKSLYEFIPSVFEFYEREPPMEVKGHTLEWMEEARFRHNGGYCKYYSTGQQVSQLHWIASHGSLKQVKDCLTSMGPSEIDKRTGNGETSLFLACARGSWEIAAVLLDAGANAAVLCTEFQISCLHWLFVFEESLQSIAATRLVASGADPNALLGKEVPFPQYPFLLPAGTPMHWAVMTGSHCAIVALLKQGGDVGVRDGSDPYRYDNRFRLLDKFGGPHQHAFSIAEKPTLGLSPLDYSVMEFDPFLVEHLLESRTRLDINAVDEEGVGLLHRLSANHIRRTRASNTYSFLPFKGSRASQEKQQRRIVSAVLSLGGDLNKVTTPGPMCNQPGQRAALESYTPLMLAAEGGYAGIFKLLLEAGASTSFRNSTGNTALSCLPHNDEHCCQIISLLVSAGASIHTRGRFGNTPLIQAAAYRNLLSVDLLLSLGADVNNLDVNKISLHQGWDVFAFLAVVELPFVDTNDAKVAQLLNKYVFGHTDASIRHAVIHRRTQNGETLLHRFASRVMRRCVIIMLQNGAPPNAPTYKTSSRWDDSQPERVQLSWEETPLDAAREFKEKTVQRMHQDRYFSLPEYEDICARVDAVTKALKDAGGIYTDRNVKES